MNSTELARPSHEGKKLLNFASEIDIQTLEQAHALSRLPFVHPHVALMPDAHFGKGSSVGTVIPTKRAVIPAAVGVDIGCGMIAVRTNYSAADLESPIKRSLGGLLRRIEDAIPASAGNYNTVLDRYEFTRTRLAKLERAAELSPVDLSHSPKWREQLGTLGGGNHFIELCLDEDDRLWLFLHSGSRGVGNKIAQKHIRVAQKLMETWHITLEDRDHAYLPQGTPEFTEYLRELRWAQAFAMENRAEMMDRFIQCFAEWLGVPEGSVEHDRINTHHNYTERVEVGGEDVWLTRKGAIDASVGKKGIIPGSMGTRSYIVIGKGSEKGLHSAPHGAGRKFSRAEARRRFTADDLADRMQGIEYLHGEEWIDEIPDAYKDIDQVMHDAQDLVMITHELRQIMNVKGT
ncbi:RtcB-like RNA ligase [Rhodococcus phage Maselop]|nr:RtcB-like RNA ligase [Rhodococcus phage Braxoaddie]WNM64998.1 RtcB-like RNA ligase [Rhodococcus phage Maselop]WNM67459.1 RtcB-like RNA ligase [Rhodococcus phage Polyyuki]